MTIRTRLMMGLAMASVMAVPAAMAESDSTKKHGTRTTTHMTVTSTTMPSPTTDMRGSNVDEANSARNVERDSSGRSMTRGGSAGGNTPSSMDGRR